MTLSIHSQSLYGFRKRTQIKPMGFGQKLYVFNQCDKIQHLLVSHLCIRPMMSTAVTIWAKANHKERVVGPAVAQAAYVVNFQEWSAGRRIKWRELATVLALPLRSSMDIVAHSFAALKDGGGSYFGFFRCIFGRINRTFTKRRKWRALGFDGKLREGFNNGFKWAQLKDDGFALTAHRIRRRSLKHAFNDVLAFKAKPGRRLSKQQQIFSVFGVLSDGLVTTQHDHIADLAFAKVFKYTVRAQAIFVSVLPAFLASHDNDQIVILWRDDASLLLASKPSVNVLAAMVCPANFKTPGHKDHPLFKSLDATLAGAPERVERESAGGILNYPLIHGTGAGRSAQDTPEIAFSPDKEAA